MPVSGPVEDTTLTPLRALYDQREWLAALRMKRMRDPDGTGHLLGARCSPSVDQRRGGAARPKAFVGARAAERSILKPFRCCSSASPLNFVEGGLGGGRNDSTKATQHHNVDFFGTLLRLHHGSDRLLFRSR